MRMRLIDISNQKFSKLTVLEFKEVKNECAYWICRCDCGNITTVRGVRLRNGTTKTCGCLRLQNLRKKIVKHGLSKSRAFRIWAHMIGRCTNINSDSYKYYGGRGIKFCKRWGNFENFLEDMGHPPENLTLERIDNNQNYSKENCKWATRKEQSNNTRQNVRISFGGVTKNLMQWSKSTGVSYSALRERIKRKIYPPILFIKGHLTKKQKNVGNIGVFNF